MLLKQILYSLIAAIYVANALVVTEPCCHVFEHRGAMFGPQLPLSPPSIIDYLPQRKHISKVEGPLKLTDRNNWSLCSPETVARQDYHFLDSIALIPRGGCSFAEKVYSSQLLGAKAAIIFQAQDARRSVLSDTSNDDVIVMAEDSRYGDLVEIPSAFISFNSWQHIKTLLLEVSANDEIVSSYYHSSARGLVKSDAEQTKTDNNAILVNYEQAYHEKLSKQSKDIKSETTLDETELEQVRQLLNNRLIHVVLNETGSLPTTGADALPMMWDSMVFLIKVFLIIWSIMGFAYISNWVKMKVSKYKRQHVIRSLPNKKYKALHLHSNRKSMKFEDIESNDTVTPTLEEYEVEPLMRQHSDLKLRNSPKKQTSIEREQSCSVIDCDNCVICLCEFDLEDNVTVLPCKHIYHKECIEPWLVNKSSLCPICKQSIFKNGESRSINEINETEEEENQTHETRGNPVIVTIGMFCVIIFSLTFLLSDDNN